MDKNYQKWVDIFVKLSCDNERWRWVRDHQHLDIVVMCDNDDTFIIFPDGLTATFDEYIGWSSGIFSLLDGLRIVAESV